MRLRSRWWVLSVLSFLGSGTAAYAQHDPNAFTSLGTLNVTNGSLTLVSRAATWLQRMFVSLFCLAIATGLFLTPSAMGQVVPTYVDSFGTAGTGNGQFNTPRGIAVSSTNFDVYVVDGLNNRVERFDGNGTYLNQWGSSGGGSGTFNSPVGITYDGLNNRVYVADGTNGLVQRFSNLGAFQTQWSASGTVSGIDYQSGSIYVARTSSGTVLRTDTNGASGTSYGSISNPQGVAIDASLNSYIVAKGANSVSKFNSSLSQTLVIGSGTLNSPTGAAHDDLNGRLYVVDTGNNRVARFDSSTGALQFTFGTAGSGDGQLSGAHSIATATNGVIYVTDSGNNRVQRWFLPSQWTTAATNNFANVTLGESLALNTGMTLNVAGTTTINSGTLTVSTGAFSSPSTNLGGSSTGLTFAANSGTVTFAGDVTGSGVLTKTGGSTLILTGSTTVSTAISLSAGTLQIGSGGTSGALSSDVSNSASLVFNRSNTSTYSGNITGVGNVTQAGSGTLIATGTWSHTGTTTVSAGTLQIGNGGTVGLLSSDIISNANLTFARSDVLAYNSTVTGTGSVTQAGPGLLVLTGSFNNAAGVTISGGTLQIGDGAATGVVAGSITNNSNLVFNRSDAVAFSNALSGTGNLSKIAAGQLTLSGTNTYTGTTIINQGTLQFNSNLSGTGGAVIVNGGGTLAGNGVTLSRRVLANAGSTIDAIGNLTVGDATRFDGFTSQGEVITRGNTLTLNDANQASLGEQNTLGQGGTPGTIVAANGVFLDFSRGIAGYGTINTPNNLIQRSIINGTVQGTSGAQPITFTGWIKGAGTFTNVVFAGTWDPGFSPTLITAGSIGFSSTNSLIMELGGMTRGSQFDGIDATGNVNLAGALSITRINGFSPNTGDTFVLINRTGGTGTFTGLNEGDTFLGTDGAPYIISYQGMNYITNMMAPGANGFSVVISAVPEPTTWALIGLSTAAAGWMGYRRFKQSSRNWEAEIASPHEELI